LKDFKPKRVEVIPNGVNFEFMEKRKNGKKILYVGRIEKYKGLDFVVKALKLLPDFRLEIVGKGSYKREIIKLAKKLLKLRLERLTLHLGMRLLRGLKKVFLL
jgi:glycosyltransferase involved in cell wall biosynthesis